MDAGPTLQILGDPTGHRYVLAARTTIGRDAACTIVLDDPLVSRVHAAVIEERGVYRLEDQSSANGTTVNGHGVTSTMLRHGDEIRVGAVALLFQASLHAAGEAPSRTRHRRWTVALAVVGGLAVALAVTLPGTGLWAPVGPVLAKRYVDRELGVAFKLPLGWMRVSKTVEPSVFPGSIHTVVVHASRIRGTQVVFAVDVVTQVPPLALEELPSLGEQVKEFLYRGSGPGHPYRVENTPALQVRIESDEPRGRLTTQRTYLLTGDRRLVLIGGAPSPIFDEVRPIFEAIVASVETLAVESLTTEEMVRRRARAEFLLNLGARLFRERGVDVMNLQRSLTAYQEAVGLLATVDPLTLDTLEAQRALQQTQAVLEARYQDLEFEIEWRLRTGEPEAALRAATTLMALVPAADTVRSLAARDRYEHLRRRLGWD